MIGANSQASGKCTQKLTDLSSAKYLNVDWAYEELHNVKIQIIEIFIESESKINNWDEIM